MATDPAVILKSVPEGAVIEDGVPFPGLAPNQRLSFRMRKKFPETLVYNIDVEYFGIVLSRVVAKVTDSGKLLWQGGQ